MGLKVLLLVNRVPWPIKDGGTLAHYNLLKGLSDAGCDITLAAMNTTKHHVDVKKLPTTFTRLAKLHAAYVDNRVKALPAFINLFSKQSYNIQRFITTTYEQLLVDLLSKHQFDLILFDGLYTAPYIDVVRKHSKAKIWLRQHNVEYKIWESLANQTKQLLKKNYVKLLTNRLKKFEQQVLPKFDAIIALTQKDITDMQALGCHQPMFVSPVGIDFKQTVSKMLVQPKSVFHLGAMDWQPNQQAMEWFLTEVWPLVIKQEPDAIFYMAGKKMPASFKKYQTSNIKIMGEVEDATVFMQSKQIMVVPLFAGSGIRVKILEGMSLGKAIVTTTLGVEGIEAQNKKHVLVADDAQTFAASIVELLQNQTKTEQLGNEAKQLATDQYHNNKVITRLLNFYNTQQHA
jgi:glycosyltransferase involved in cell wall biosynthesis